MEDHALQICPWCDHEIVWDPEFGPDEVCPNCENELSGFRSIQVSLEPDETKHADIFSSDRVPAGKATHLEELAEHNRYLEQVQKLTDQQLEAPECPTCYQFMLHAGVESVQLNHIEFARSPFTGKPLLPAKIDLAIYVCPSCFKVEKYLSASTRQAWIRQIE